MLEVVLILGVAVVLIYLYYTLQEYLKNPLKDPPEFNKPKEALEVYVLPNPLETLKESEAGVLASLMGSFTKHLEPTPLSQALLEVFLQDLSQIENKDLKSLQEIYHSPPPPLDQICTQLLECGHGEYKKRLKWVEFLFVLAYSDGNLGTQEKEALLDAGAFLNLENVDFNNLYDGFANLKLEPLNLEPTQISTILRGEKIDFKGFKALVQECYINVLEPKNWNKSYLPDTMKNLWQLEQAYDALNSSLKA
ncbi:TerB family tellurite resistance protein [Helicobacter suis]|uniref:TerB family tellurite resistance protein n=1 Tax=Helicobacter suis TaxID=104628 RepID=UPI0013D516D1|nr:TerB family tellurite resistance protein [Helicobacter suis]